MLPGPVESDHVFGVPIDGALTDIGVPENGVAFRARHG